MPPSSSLLPVDEPAVVGRCTSPEVPTQQGVDLLPAASYSVARGGMIRCTENSQKPSSKTVDGDPSDWVGEPSRFGGVTRLSRGELIYSDFLFDAYGADDGVDKQRLDLLDPLASIEARTTRLDALFQAAGTMFGAPTPVGALDHYGNTTTLADEADLFELRWAADATHVYMLARFTTLTDPAHVAVLILLNHGESAAVARVGYGSGLTSAIYDKALLITADGVRLRDLKTGQEKNLSAARVAVNANGWNNALELALPVELFASRTKVSVVSGKRTPQGIIPANVAYRFDEPVTIYNDKLQALSLHAGTVDAFAAEIDLDQMRAGATESIFPGPGYHERQFVSGENISREVGEDGLIQHYGLYVPSAYAPAPKLVPLTFWLHFNGGKAHSAGAWMPRLIHQLGENPGHLVVTPRGRGTATWYVTQGHQDFFEVYTDVHALFPNIDPNRRYLSGYSMGGYGTYLFGLLYPDLFAAGYSTSGAPTQGLWTGLGPDGAACSVPSLCFVETDNGNADAQHTFRLLENARNFPLAIHHGSNDELVPISGVEHVAERLLELGYRYDFTTFFGYEHYTQAIIDEWADGAAYLEQFTRPSHPRRVTYKIVPALLRSLNTIQAKDIAFNFHPDGAWWVQRLKVRDQNADDPSQFGMIDAESFALPAATVLSVPRVLEVRPTAVSTPVFAIGAHSTPYLRVGLDWLETGEEPLSNGFSVHLTRLAAATLDVEGMNLDLTRHAEGTVATDGTTALRFTHVGRTVRVFVNGVELVGTQTGDSISLSLPEGAHTLSFDPA